MKTKIFALFAAMMLLVGTTAMAQSDDTKNTSTTETSLKGDVNNDGVVDVADIAANIIVMNEQGTVEAKYYWYIGTEKLTSDLDVETKGFPMTSFSEMVTSLMWTESDYVYFIYPAEFGTAKIVDADDSWDAPGKAVETLSTVNFTKYKGWRFNKDNQGVKYIVSFP